MPHILIVEDESATAWALAGPSTALTAPLTPPRAARSPNTNPPTEMTMSSSGAMENKV